MVDKKIEPFEYQKSTNIDEHNQIVGKVNEIVDAINEVNLDEIAPEIADLDTRVDKNTADISQLKISDAEHTEQIATIDSNVDNHAREITALKTADAKHDTEIAELDKVTDALTKEIPNGITLYRDGTGKIKAVISQEDDTTIDSNVLDMIIPYQYTIISGTTSRSFKLKIVMSDGSEVITNDFIIPEGGGSVVTITGIEIDKDATDVNKFLVKAIVNEGDPITSNAISMVDSVSGTFANNKLTIKVNGISSTPITIDTTGTTYTAGNGIKIASGVISIDDTKVALKSDISDMETKTHANATFATKTALTTLQNSVGDAFSQVAVGSDGKSLDFTALDGQVNNVALPSSGGSNWELITEQLTYSSSVLWGNQLKFELIDYNDGSTELSGYPYCIYYTIYSPIVIDGSKRSYKISSDTYVSIHSVDSLDFKVSLNGNTCTQLLSKSAPTITGYYFRAYKLV